MSLPSLIGLAGYARSGKDTAGAYLDEKYGYCRLAFADKLRELAWLIEPGYGAAVQSLGYETAKDVYPDLRRYLVRLGAGARQVLGQDVWLDALLPQEMEFPDTPARWKGGRTVITDVRYVNEAQRIIDLGGQVWYLDRDNKPANDEEHRSIREMLNAVKVTVFLNEGTVEDLYRSIDLELAYG